MKELELTYSPYRLILNTAFETSRGKISERKGFIISLKSENGKTGLGDAAPFPEFGSESYEETDEALNKIELKINLDLGDLRKSLKYIFRNYEAFPALRHGLEQALLNLICNERNLSLSEVLKLKLKDEIFVNAAIGFLSAEETYLKVKDLKVKGFNTIKIKVGRSKFEEDLEILKAARNAAGSDIKVRVDVNGKWDLDCAIKNLKQLEELDIEYAEQPANSIEDFIEIKKETSILIAADESIRNYISAKAFILGNAVDIIVLKPMLIGGLVPTLEIIELAEKYKVIPVITSSFESAIGRANLVIAAASVKADIAHGLAVSKYFEQDITNDKFPIVSGKISI
jgi:o-succinylbenzoate synthase